MKASATKLALLAGAASLSASLAAAEEQVAATSGKEVVVSANRIPVETDKVGASVSSITAEEIEERQYKTVSDAVRALPGVTVNQNGGLGSLTTARIRGNSSDQTLVIIDGVVVNDPATTGGGFNFANLDISDVERIEVLRGPQSTLYGSNAIGGVINIITKRGEGDPTVSASLEGGSYETLRGFSSVSGAQDGLDYRFSASGVHSDGISRADEDDGNPEEDSYDNVTFSGNLGYQALETLRFDGFARYSDSRSEFDGFDVVTFTFGDADEVAEEDELALGGSATLTLFEGYLDNRFSVNYSQIDRQNTSQIALLPTAFESLDSTGERFTLEYQGTAYLTATETLVFGAEREETSIDQSSAYYDSFAMMVVPDSISADTSNNSVYALLQTEFIENLTLTGGVRYDDHEDFGSATTFRVTGAYRIESSDTILRASWGEGFKAPSLYQLNYICTFCFPPQVSPSSNLEPEESRAWDVGIEQRFFEGDLSLQAIYFQQRTKNLINFDFSQGYTNVGRAESQGVELIAAYRATDWLTLDGNYAYIYAQDLDADTQLLRQPKHTAAFNATVMPTEPSYISLGITYNGEERDTGGVILDEWVRLDLRGGYRVTENVEIFGRVENLLDENYQEVRGNGTPGVSGYLGVRATY